MKRVLCAIIVTMMATSSANAQDIYYSGAQPSCGCNGSIQSQSFPVQSMPMASSMNGNQVYYNSVPMQSNYSNYSTNSTYQQPTTFPSSVGNVAYQSVTNAQAEIYSTPVNVYSQSNGYQQTTGYAEVGYPSSMATSSAPVTYESPASSYSSPQIYNEVPASSYASSTPMTYATSSSNYSPSSEVPMTTAGTFTSNRMSTPTTYSSPAYSPTSYNPSPTYVAPSYSIRVNSSANYSSPMNYSTPVSSYSNTSSGGGISATQKAQQAAQMGLKGHVGGAFCSGAKFEGVGWSTGSAQDAIQRCCYWGTRPVAQIGTCRGPDGWYACVMYY